MISRQDWNRKKGLLINHEAVGGGDGNAFERQFEPKINNGKGFVGEQKQKHEKSQKGLAGKGGEKSLAKCLFGWQSNNKCLLPQRVCCVGVSSRASSLSDTSSPAVFTFSSPRYLRIIAKYS
jgi:hypothetical protein